MIEQVASRVNSGGKKGGKGGKSTPLSADEINRMVGNLTAQARVHVNDLERKQRDAELKKLIAKVNPDDQAQRRTEAKLLQNKFKTMYV